MPVIHAPQENSLEPKVLVMPAILCLAFAGFIYRLWDLQIARSADYREVAERSLTIDDSILPPRGQIFDRNGVPLAQVKPTYVAFVSPAAVAKDKELLSKLATLTGLDVKMLERNFRRYSALHKLHTPVAPELTMEQAALIAEAGSTLTGVTVELRPMRTYADPVSVAHLLGYVGPQLDPKAMSLDLAERPPDFTGRTGLEKSYDLQLSGRNGTTSFAVDARRRPLKFLSSQEPVPGMRLVSTINLALQKEAIRLLDGRAGSLVAIDVRNGELITLASSPTFDLRARWGGDEDAIEQLEDLKELSPELFRPVFSRKAPGSTFKVVTTIAAMLAGKFNPSTTVDCPGYFQSGNFKLKCENHGKFMRLNFQSALAFSCNTYFGNLARSLTKEQLFSAYDKLGLTSKTGIDLTSEWKGLALTDESFGHNPPRVTDGDRAQLGIGQGKMATTPLQMALVTALIANEGRMPKPKLVGQMVDPVTEQIVKVPNETRLRVDLPSNDWAILKQAMVGVVTSGTAARAKTIVPSAGKTGSAEERKDKPTHSWYIAYAPADRPQIAICVMVENAGHGGDVAAPIAGEWLTKYFSAQADPSVNSRSASVEVAKAPASPDN